MKKNFSTKKLDYLFITGLLWVSSFSIFESVFAQNTYRLIVPIPGYGGHVGGSGGVSLTAYLSAIIKVGIILAAMLAVIKIIIAGFSYITAGGSAGKIEQAKQMIWDALVGLFIAAGFYLILMAINPNIINNVLTIDPVPFIDLRNL